jgi:hypothetical protein
VPRSPRKPKFLSLYGVAQDGKKAYLYGRIHALPQQQGIHGFQRIVVKKFFLDANGNYNGNDVYYYEGCVLPGGKIIVGRWWNAFQDPNSPSTMSGPFMWWSVGYNASIEPNDPDEILEFARHHHH